MNTVVNICSVIPSKEKDIHEHFNFIKCADITCLKCGCGAQFHHCLRPL